MKDFHDKVAVVTGAASGIGLGVAERLLAEGMKVVMADLEQETLEGEIARLSAAGGDVLGVRCDVRDAGEVKGLAEKTLSHYGGVHVVMNNAGVAPIGPMLETTADDWRWVFDVNLMGVVHGVLAFGPILKEAGTGHIINTASEAGLVTNPILGMYCASKHAVVGLSESLYRELEGSGVGVHVLCPNLVKTKIFHSERNREDAPDMTPSQTAFTGSLRETLDAMGITTEKVAGDVVDAMRHDRFWILTHEFTVSCASKRYADINKGENPSDPYAQVEAFGEPEGSFGPAD